MTYSVYKITNEINNKVYTGQASRTIKSRFSTHCTKDRSSIKVALREPHRTCGGHHWKYLEMEVA